LKRSILSLGIIILFIWSVISPIVISNNIKTSNEIVSESTGDDVDWWPMFHHDLNRSGYSTSTGPDTNNVLWAFQAEGRIHQSSPAVVDNKVYFGCDNINFYCLNSDTGEKIWQTLIPGGIYASSPAVDNGKVYFGTLYQNRGIYCLNATNGEIIWRYQTPPGNTIIASPAVYQGKVFIGAPNPEPGCMYCLDVDTGEEIWVSQAIDFPVSAVVYNDRVYFGAKDFNVYCLDANNGTVIWKYTTEGHNEHYIYVIIYDGKLYAGGEDGLYCLNIKNGSLIWKYPTDKLIFSTPCTANGNIYFGADDGILYCLNATYGEKIWDFDGMKNSYIRSSPAYADGKIYISPVEYDKVFCLDATSGEKIWDFNTVSEVWSSPAIADGKVYIGLESGEFLCFGGESDNKPPITPKEIFGPTTCKLDVKYKYNTTTFDPNGDQLYYKWEWYSGGTNWIGPVNSNETVEVNITFIEYYGIHKIRVIVKDCNHARSDWTELEVRVPRDKSISSSPLLMLLERYPFLQALLIRLGLQ